MGMIDEYGFTSPLVVVGKELKAGHGRVEAARRILDAGGHIYPAPGRKNGAEPFEDGYLPAIDATGWSEAQARAYVIAENRSAELAEWDSEMLALEIEDLRLGGFDIDLTGFDSAALNAIFDEAAGAEGYEDNTASSTIELDANYDLAHKCPKCGFEYD
jgi:ParB-like chromosome segregation protein Spo0J